MIQRIQSLYMLITAVLMGVTAFCPLAEIGINGVPMKLQASGLVYMEILVAIAALLPFVMIWLFKNLLLQLRLCFAEIMLLVGAQAFFVIYIMKVYNGVSEGFGDVYMSAALPTVFPAIGIVLMILSIRAVSKDFRKINSLNRLR